jgi:glycosyltransferase involved in cell wall biosynthesis
MEEHTNPIVAIITPLYNDEIRVIRAIESVRGQTIKNYLHFIFDDGSTDNSRESVREIISKYNDNRIILITSDTNEGQSRARNKLINEVYNYNIDYVAFIDSDDYWNNVHLQELIDAAKSEHAGMVYSTPIFVDDNRIPLLPYNIPTDQEPTYDNISKANSVYISSVLLKTSCMKTVGYFDSELDCIEDWDYWLRVIEDGFKVYKLNKANTFYVVREDGMAGKSDGNKLTKFKKKHNIEECKPIKLNLGCGDEILSGYINCDIDSAGADMMFDAAKIPFPDNSIDEIRAYHLIEHFPFRKGLEVLKEWFRVLKPSGKLVLETPDFLNTCKKFIEVDEQTRIVLYGHFFAWPDLSPWQTHYFLFTEIQMFWSLQTIGFTNIQRVPPDSIYAKCNPEWQELYLKVEAYK